MATQNFNITYKRNTGRVFSAEDIKTLYFFGIPLTDPATGEEMLDETIEFYIDTAQEEMENFLYIKLRKQIYTETRNFNFSDFRHWVFTPTTYPVREAVSLNGYLNSTLQISYPEHWMSVKSSSDNKFFYRKINLVPISGSAASIGGSSLYLGLSPYIGFFGNKSIPDYWEVSYITGFSNIPKDILDFMGKKAAISIFHQLGDLIAGVGVASKSIGIDGLSASLSTTSSATNAGYGARIIGYQKDLAKAEIQLKNTYVGITFAVA